MEEIRATEMNKNHRIIVTNVPFNIPDEKILSFFNGAVSLERHTKNGKLSGAVFVQCKSMSDVHRFVKTCNSKELEGREIGVSHLQDREVYQKKKEQNEKKKDQEKKKELDENERGRIRRQEYESSKKRKLPETEEERTLFITNLSFKDTEEEIQQKFLQYGEVEQCTLVTDRNTKVPTGRAFVMFKDPESCKAALKDQVILNNRVLVVLRYVAPEVLKRKEDEKDEKNKKREKKIKDRKEGKIPPMDPERRSTCRVHISHMTKKLNRKTLSLSIEEYFSKAHNKKVRLRGVNLTTDRAKKNPGYGFVTFKFPEDAETFLKNQKELHRALGWKMVAEYAMESKEFLEKGIKKNPSREERLAKRNQ